MIAIFTLLCAVCPAIAVGWSVAMTLISTSNVPSASHLEPALTPSPAWGLLVSTLAWSFGIGLGATALAWPVAWLIRQRGWAVLPVLLTPLLLPSYLAYSGYSTLRAAGTPLGNLIERWAVRGHPDLPSYTGRFLAGAGLVLWAWPIAVVVLGAAVKRFDEDVMESLRADAPPWRRHLQVLMMSRVPILGAIAAIALVMMGSAVPLHLAQVPTYAIKVWLDLTLSPTSGRVWLAAWPLLLIAVAASVVVTRTVLKRALVQDEAVPPSKRAGIAPGLSAGIVWSFSVLAPLLLFATSVKDPRQYAQFWRLSSDAVGNSGSVALGAALVGIVLTAGFWQAVSAARAGAPTALVGACLAALLASGLIPGVLVGTAWATACQITPAFHWLGDSLGVMVLAHVTRFGFVAALVGCWLTAVEPKGEREQRTIDGGLGFAGWLRACLPVQGGALAGAGLMMGALSLHEIEAAVVLQPPGSMSLAQTMLAHLHQLRMQDVSSASVMVVLLGLGVAMIAAGAGWLTARQAR